MKRINLVALSILLLAGCKNNNPTDEQAYVNFDWSNREYKLTNPQKIVIDSIIDIPIGFDIIGKHVVMQCPNSTEVYTLNGDTLKFKNTLIKQGQGPAEVVSGSEFYQLNDGRYAVVEGIGSKKTFISKTNDINELSDVGG